MTLQSRSADCIMVGTLQGQVSTLQGQVSTLKATSVVCKQRSPVTPG